MVLVDNTNTTAAEIAPYHLLGESFGYVVDLYTMVRDVDNLDLLASDYINLCHARTSHGVPLDTVKRQYRFLQERTLPSWWRKDNVISKF